MFDQWMFMIVEILVAYMPSNIKDLKPEYPVLAYVILLDKTQLLEFDPDSRYDLVISMCCGDYELAY